MTPSIVEVKTRSQLKKWVEFPNELYKNNEYYVPFMFEDEMSYFTPQKNPAYSYCETKLFLAYHGKKIVGRIGVLINKAYNEKWDKRAIRFTRFDFIDDYDVSAALFAEVTGWAKERGLTQVNGPIGFHDMDHEGMLVEGFDQLNMSITFYNHPYYLAHMERLGLRKDIDWVEYKVYMPNKPNERIAKISDYVIKRHGFKLVTYDKRKDLISDAREAFDVIDEAFSKLYGTVPLTKEVVQKAIDDNISIVNLKYVCSIKDRDGKLVAFALMVPSIAKALKKCNGKLLPFGFIPVLNAINGKNDVLEMYFVAVKPEYQKAGLPGIIMNALVTRCIENGVTYCETGPELETNTNVQSLWKTFKVEQHKRRRCFIGDIEA